MTATITISANDGGITSTRSANDTNAARTFDGLLRQNGYDVDAMTNQEKLDTSLLLLVQYARESAKAYEATAAAQDAAENVVDTYPPPFEP